MYESEETQKGKYSFSFVTESYLVITIKFIYTMTSYDVLIMISICIISIEYM